ncbi:hypothetical protein CYB_0573 [Synechococcus sp. JA-2-3B'a(2-13)]|uniref:hypothetical protein n=1 Tax=unclassified Synechococcus TaxID=2626047 RepID=UPI0000694B92|nr:hypothetical protein [Synechococcus sp. JA-2-3B'a(2-13)]ABD01564.1 hypothetical protein CYB_0573 [Synechococcus sp. JA-2-3B'a(2-13)]
MVTFNLDTDLDLTQPLAVFLQGLNWDNRPPAKASSAQELPPQSPVLFAQSVGQFFAGFNWSGICPRSEPLPEFPAEDPFTLEDFAALFGGALL